LSTRMESHMSYPVFAGPVGSQKEQLESLLQRRLGNRVRDLSVLVLPRGLVLQGRTATYHAKQLAQHAVMELSSLPLLANDIEVC
jgi:hypothetical protein